LKVSLIKFIITEFCRRIKTKDFAKGEFAFVITEMKISKTTREI